MKTYYPLRNGTAFMGMRAEAPFDEWGPEAAYYLASDVDRLRAEAREKLAEFIASEVHNDDSAPCTACYTQSDEYLNVIFGEDKHDRP